MAYDEQFLNNSKIKIKFEEDYTSDSIAKYNYGTQNFGIAKGFDLQPDGDQTVRLSHESNDDESVAIIHDEPERRAFVVVEPTENVLDISNFSGDTVYIFLHVNYQINQDTALSIRVSDVESGEPWIEKSTLVGSVDVPSGFPISNPITISDIDLFNTDFVGVDSTISGTKWNILNSNSEFRRRLTGYKFEGETGYVGYNDVDENLLLGLNPFNGTLSGGSTASVLFGDGNLNNSDDVYIRLEGSASDLTSGAKLLLETPSEVFELASGQDGADISSWQKGVRFQLSNATGNDIKLTVDLSDSSGTEGVFEVSKFEVYTHNFPRKDGTIESKEKYDLIDKTQSIAGNKRLAIEHVDYEMAFTDMGVDTIKLSEWESYEDLPVETNIGSILEGIMHGSKGAGVVDVTYPGRVISGLSVVTNGNQAVDIKQGQYTSVADRKQARLEDVPLIEGFDVTTDGGTYYIVIDPEIDPNILDPTTSGFIKQEPFNILDLENNEYVPLAVVDTDSSSITDITDARDFLPSAGHTDSTKVGDAFGDALFNPDQPRFNSLAYACRLLSQIDNGRYAYRGNRLIEIVSDINVPSPISVPSDCTIQSYRGATLNIQNIDNDSAFDLTDVENVTFRDLNVVGDDSTTFGIGQVTFAEGNGTLSNITFDNVNLLSDGDGDIAMDKGIDMSNVDIDGMLKVQNCRLKSNNESISVGTNGNLTGKVLIKDCIIGSFDNFSSVNTKSNHITINPLGKNTVTIKGCKVGFCDGSANYGVWVNNDVIIEECEFVCEVILNEKSILKNCIWNFDGYVVDAVQDNPLIVGESPFGDCEASGVTIKNSNSDSNFTGIKVKNKNCFVSNVSIDYMDGQAIYFEGKEHTLQGASILKKPSVFSSVISIDSPSSNISISDIHITFDGTNSQFSGTGIFVSSGANSISIDNLQIHCNLQYAIDFEGPVALDLQGDYSKVNGIKVFCDKNPVNTGAVILVGGIHNLISALNMQVPDIAIRDFSSGPNSYSDMLIDITPSNSTVSSRTVFDLEDPKNVTVQNASLHNTWDGSSNGLKVLPFFLGNSTDGVTIRDCMIEADANEAGFDPQNDSSNYLIDSGESSSSTNNKKTLLLNSGNFAHWELTAIPVN